MFEYQTSSSHIQGLAESLSCKNSPLRNANILCLIPLYFIIFSQAPLTLIKIRLFQLLENRQQCLSPSKYEDNAAFKMTFQAIRLFK